MARESDIQAEILLALSRAFHPDGVFWRQNSGSALSPDGARRIKLAPIGSADVVGVLRGRFVEVEVKTRTGKQRPEQAAHQAAVERAGGIYIVARSAEEAISLLRAAMSLV